MNFFQRVALLFKDPKNTDAMKQAPYPRINIDDIPPASAILFYNGNRVTERAGARLYGCPYWPPAFHAAFYIGNRMFLNVGEFRTIEDLTTELRSTRRADVVIYNALTPDQRAGMARAAMLDTSKERVGLTLPDYAVTDYLRFLVRGIHPSKSDFCSENVAEIFGRASAQGLKSVESWAVVVAAAAGIRIAQGLPVDTAPWDIEKGAEALMAGAERRTLWVGPDYPF